eukprot:TsM_000740000 transcript=TsM_000740000 gene=TsM_000740000
MDEGHPVTSVPSPLQQQISTITDSGFTTTIETPQSLHQTPTPVPSDTERTLTFHSVLLQLLETDGEEHADFAEDSILVLELADEKPPSRFFIAEQIRMALEKTLDLDTLIKCYNVVQNLQESEDDELHIGREVIASIVGQSRASEVFDRVLQLVLADGTYIDGNTTIDLRTTTFELKLAYLTSRLLEEIQRSLLEVFIKTPQLLHVLCCLQFLHTSENVLPTEAHHRLSFNCSKAAQVSGGLNRLSAPSILCSMTLRRHHRLTYRLRGQAGGGIDDETLFLAGTLIASRDVENAVDVNIEGYLDARHTMRLGRDVDLCENK